MGGVVSAVEIVLIGGLLAQQMTQAAIKQQLQRLIYAHDQEFDLMNKLYKFVDAIVDQENLVSQLDANVDFSNNNWNEIGMNLNDKNESLNRIVDYFPQINASGFNQNFSFGMKFTANMLNIAFSSFCFISEYPRVQLSKDPQTFKNFFSKTSKIIKSFGPEIMGCRITPEGLIEVNRHGTNAENAPRELRESKTGKSKIKAHEQSGWKTKLAMGIRLIVVASMIFSFVKGAIELDKLKKELDYYRNYFTKQGEFQEAKKGIIELMGSVAADILNLASYSQTAFVDSRNLFLILSVTLARNQETVLDFAKRLDQTKFGLTQDFIEKSKALVDSCNEVSKSGKSTAYKLQDLEQLFRTFFYYQNPERVFRELSMELSEVMSQYGLISDSINDDQYSVNRIIDLAGEFVKSKRNQDFEKQSLEVKKSVDTEILKKTLAKYFMVFDLTIVPIYDLDGQTKDNIFHLITSFVDNFYYDDDTGLSLFGKKIADFKGSKNYKEIIKSDISNNIVTPVREKSGLGEQLNLNSWKNLAQQQNKRLGYIFWPSNSVPKSGFRYIRLSADEVTNAEGKITHLQCFEGMTIHSPKELYIERNILTSEVSLRPAL